MTKPQRFVFWLVALLIIAGVVLVCAMRQCQVRHSANTRYSPLTIEQRPADHELDIVFGNADAPHTIYMYANYQCRYCQQFFEEVLPNLSSWLDNKGVRLVLKLVGKSTHPAAQRAQRAAVSVHRYGNYTALHNLLTFNYLSVYTDEFQGMVDDFIDRDHQLAQLMLEGEAESYLEANNQEFDGMGFEGTPVFVMHDHAYVGFRNLSTFSQIVDFELKRKNKLN